MEEFTSILTSKFLTQPSITISPFARSSHMVWNKSCWDVSYIVGLSKQRKVGLDWYKFLCFGSPAVFLASQHILFSNMWLDRAKGLLDLDNSGGTFRYWQIVWANVGRFSLHTSKVAHQAWAYPSFCSMKRLGIFQFPLNGMLVHCRATPSIKFASANLYTRVERGTVTVKCLTQEHNAMGSIRGGEP